MYCKHDWLQKLQSIFFPKVETKAVKCISAITKSNKKQFNHATLLIDLKKIQYMMKNEDTEALIIPPREIMFTMASNSEFNE